MQKQTHDRTQAVHTQTSISTTPVDATLQLMSQVGQSAELQTPGVHQRAQAGMAGSGDQLPHLPAIQQAFGRHDVSAIQAYTGGAAAAASDELGAEAYATDSAVAFKSNPSLHLAAHEAAHIVQQQGGVALSGGVGQQGDSYERHADAVADAVVAGQSAEGLLDQVSGNSPAIQRKAVQFYRGKVNTDKGVGSNWRIGENEETAVSQESSSGGKHLFATASKITSGNAALTAAKSGIKLTAGKATITVGGKTLLEAKPTLNPGVATPNDTKLKDVNAGKIKADDGTKTSDTLGLWTDCGRASRVTTAGMVGAKYKSGGADAQTAKSGNPATFSNEIYLKSMAEFLADPANYRFLVDGIHFTAFPTPNYSDIAARVHKAIDGLGTDEEAVYKALGELHHNRTFIEALKKAYQAKYKVSIVSDIRGDFSGSELTKALNGLTVDPKAPPGAIIQPTTAKQARAQFVGLGAGGSDAFSSRFGINEYANPDVGDTYTMATESDMPGFTSSGMTWNFHWAGVIMKDGSDNITCEGYAIDPSKRIREARNKFNKPADRAKLTAEIAKIRKWAAHYIDRDFFIQMYGTLKKKQTFHHEHATSGTHGSHQSSFAAGK